MVYVIQVCWQLASRIRMKLNALIFQIYSWNENLHVSDRFSVHHQESSTAHTAMVYVIQVCWQLASRIRMKLNALIFQIYSWNENLHVSDRFSVHHQESSTVHTAMVHVIQVYWQLASRIRIELDALISQIYSWNKNLHVSDRFSVHHQESSTVHTAMVYVIQFCWQLASRIRMELSSNLIARERQG